MSRQNYSIERAVSMSTTNGHSFRAVRCWMGPSEFWNGSGSAVRFDVYDDATDDTAVPTGTLVMSIVLQTGTSIHVTGDRRFTHGLKVVPTVLSATAGANIQSEARQAHE